MTVIPKQEYYAGRGLSPRLTRHYFSKFGSARKILDVGCGTGDLGRYSPWPDIEIHGVDIDSGAVDQASAYERAICLDIAVSPLPYEDESFEAILARDVLEHLLDPSRALAEVRRVLKPAGILVVSVVMAKPRRVWADYTHVRGFTRSSARLLLEDVGFTVEHIWRMGPVPLSSRLGFVGLVPQILKLPGANQLWASSWELKARKW